MNQNSRRFLLGTRIAVDLSLILIAWVAAYYMRFATFESPLGIPPLEQYLRLLPFIVGIWFIVFSTTGFYKRTLEKRSVLSEGLDIITSCWFATITFVTFTYFYDEYKYSRLTIFLFGVFQPIFLITGRSAVRKFVRRGWLKLPTERVLIIGSGKVFNHTIDSLHDYGFQIEAREAIVIGADTHCEASRKVCQKHQITEIDPPQNWAQFFSEKRFDKVVIALSHSDYDFIEKNLYKIAEQMTNVVLIPDIIQYTKFSAGIEYLGQLPVINIHESPLQGSGHVWKRVLDIIGAVIAIIVFLPAIVFISLLVPATSKGPILYRQKRMGLDGRTFDILKFRSMPIDAESRTGAIWAKENDSRVTRVGRILRKLNLDEIPQLINVLRGEMSLVGPRPERPVFVQDFRQSIPNYMLRHKVKAGMTGWAQVNGLRGNTSLEKRIEFDLFYIQNWSIKLDFKILVLTVWRSFFDKNAY